MNFIGLLHGYWSFNRGHLALLTLPTDSISHLATTAIILALWTYTSTTAITSTSLAVGLGCGPSYQYGIIHDSNHNSCFITAGFQNGIILYGTVLGITETSFSVVMKITITSATLLHTTLWKTNSVHTRLPSWWSTQLFMWHWYLQVRVCSGLMKREDRQVTSDHHSIAVDPGDVPPHRDGIATIIHLQTGIRLLLSTVIH